METKLPLACIALAAQVAEKHQEALAEKEVLDSRSCFTSTKIQKLMQSEQAALTTAGCGAIYRLY